MESQYYKQYEPIFGAWHITRLIGEGSLGKVFAVRVEDDGLQSEAALKAVTISQSPEQKQRTVEQIALVNALKSCDNIVSYENYQILPHPEGTGWDILLLMELLTPLDQYLRQQSLSRQEILHLGIDLCKALEQCRHHRIVHLDIKPGNIFRAADGTWKLGDFDIARVPNDGTAPSSPGGTLSYMAPEVYTGKDCGFQADLYSLGLVLYQLLNGNRLPFLPAAPAPFSFADREQALRQRLSGAPLPMPGHADKRLGEIVRKACAFEPQNRYADAAQMRQALEQVDDSSPMAPADELPGHGWPREWRTDEISSFVLRQDETEFTCDGDQVTMKLYLERDGQPFAPIVVRLTAAQQEALREQLECIRQDGWAMTREQWELLGAHDYEWNTCFQCELTGGRLFQYCSNDGVPSGFPVLYEFLYRLAFPRGRCPEDAHAFVPATLRGGWNSGPRECLYCENCGLTIPLWIAEIYPGSKIRGVAYIWPPAWRAEDILRFSVGFGDRPIRCFTWEGNLLTAVNRIDVGADGGRDFPPGYFDPVSVRLSDRQQKQLRSCLEAIPQEQWSSDTIALQHDLRCPTGYTRHTYFSCTMKSGEKFDYLPGQTAAPGFSRLCRYLTAILPWKEKSRSAGLFHRLFGSAP